MARKIAYWLSTALIGVSAVMAALSYLSGSPQAVQGFIHLGYPQQLRIILGIASRWERSSFLFPDFFA